MDNEDYNNKKKIVGIFAWVAATLITLFSIYVFFIMAKRGYDTQIWLPIAQKHFAAAIGLPMAAIVSLFIVLVLEYVSGKIELEILGLKFKGAAGQIIFWIFCFLSIVLSIKLLWELEA
ncbi:hypothetical protein [Flavobacterium sp. JAS]|uniref:hypothetical protein n=1 Tax=Flavobacterium sp. JAS TaxID=2897329 RepID=UPI001E4994D6|nr:hypothetical protein [Flavobacterium sp. JAS]MCD0468154.1 hypothetical protein [Flavobacterium sp. JAS]